jgi:hypothetical protein
MSTCPTPNRILTDARDRAGHLRAFHEKKETLHIKYYESAPRAFV